MQVKDQINVGDAVCVVLPQSCETRHAPNVLGVVKNVYKNGFCTMAAYGVEAQGEIIYYFANEIMKIPNVKVHNPDPLQTANMLLEDVFINAMVTSYECGASVESCIPNVKK